MNKEICEIYEWLIVLFYIFLFFKEEKSTIPIFSLMLYILLLVYSTKSGEKINFSVAKTTPSLHLTPITVLKLLLSCFNYIIWVHLH